MAADYVASHEVPFPFIIFKPETWHVARPAFSGYPWLHANGHESTTTYCEQGEGEKPPNIYIPLKRGQNPLASASPPHDPKGP